MKLGKSVELWQELLYKIMLNLKVFQLFKIFVDMVLGNSFTKNLMFFIMVKKVQVKR